jgi:hypothetical protein
MLRAIRYAILSLVVFAMSDLSAQTTPPTPATQQAPPCADATRRQFDFWVGSWDVTGPKGNAVGRSRVESRLGDCVIHEHWFGKGGSIGESFNIYNADTHRWEQYWVDNSGSRLHLVGGLVDGRMVLEGRHDKPDAATGITGRERIAWTPNADGTVRQLWESSKDDGKTWTVSFDGLYHKATTPVP